MRLNKRKTVSILAALLAASVAALGMSGGNLWNLAPPVPTASEVPVAPARVLQTPNDAVQHGLALILALPPAERPFYRLVWVADGYLPNVRTTAIVLNKVSRASLPLLPPFFDGGHLVLVDLRLYDPTPGRLESWCVIWEEFRFCPAFTFLVTQDALDLADQFDLHLPTRKVTRTRKVAGPLRIQKDVKLVHKGGKFVYPDDSGRVVEDLKPGNYKDDLKFKTQVDEEYTVEVSAVLGEGESVLRENSRGIDPVAFCNLQELTCSQAPIVESRYFQKRALAQIQTAVVDKQSQVFTTIWGGLYYRLRGVQTAEEFFGVGKVPPGVSDQDVFFDQFLGLGNVAGKLTAEALFNRLRSDQRAGILISGVTKKPRIVLELPTPAERGGQGKGYLTIDVNDENVDVKGRSYKNLLKPLADAQEGLFPLRTGFTVDVLFNKVGALQNEVPFNVANDSTIPSGYTQRLQPAESCMDCHYTDGSGGWKPLVNDIIAGLDFLRRPQLDIFGDEGAARKHDAFSQDTFDRLAGLYTWRPNADGSLERARADTARAYLRASGPWAGGDGSQADIAKVAGDQLHVNRIAYFYTPVSAREALWDLGLDVPDPAGALATFAAILPPDARTNVGGFYPEDPSIGFLRAGLAISRTDWALAQGFAAERSFPSVQKLKGHLK